MTLTAAFYFGSSMGSARQQQTITDMTKTATDLAASVKPIAEVEVVNKEPIDVKPV